MTRESEIAHLAEEAAGMFVVGPDDLLVVKVGDLGEQEIEDFAAAVRARLGDRALILVGDGVQLGVVREGGA